MLLATRDEIAMKSPDGTAKRVDAEEVIYERGVFPSLGEREKVLWGRSPVSPGEFTYPYCIVWRVVVRLHF